MKLAIIALLVTLLAGCKTVETIYHHGDYNNAVYSYFKAEEVSLVQQIARLEKILQDAQASNKPVAPGVHAHLAMLYFESGNTMDGTKHFEIEKQLYPESAQYIDFLMVAAQGGDDVSG